MIEVLKAVYDSGLLRSIQSHSWRCHELGVGQVSHITVTVHWYINSFKPGFMGLRQTE